MWVEDPTNRMPVYFRNRVRADLLPAMRRADPSIDDTLRAIGEAAAKWRGEVARLCDQIEELRVLPGDAGVHVPVTAVRSESMARLVWPEIAGRAGVVLDRRGIERLTAFTVASRVGARMPLSGGWQVMRGRRELGLEQDVV